MLWFFENLSDFNIIVICLNLCLLFDFFRVLCGPPGREADARHRFMEIPVKSNGGNVVRHHSENSIIYLYLLQLERRVKNLIWHRTQPETNAEQSPAVL